jgi:hypothetical protein
MRLYERQAKLLFAVIVAGKSAKFASNALDAFLKNGRKGELPFDMLQRLDSSSQLLGAIKASKCGNYGKVCRCFRELCRADLSLLNCGPEDLEKIHGIGPKTSRFFIIWTRPEERYAALDVHVLRWMREQRGYDTPKSTPSGRRYRELEEAFIHEANELGMTPRELDSEIWERATGLDSNARRL